MTKHVLRSPRAMEPPPAAYPSGDISLKELWQILWRGKLLILAATLLCGIIAAVASLVVPRTYEASVVVAPLSDQSELTGGVGALLSQYSGLASLAGIVTSANDRRSEAIAILDSAGLTRKYIRDNNLIPILFDEIWDSRAGKWLTDDPREIPTLWQANMYFINQIRSISQDPKTGMVTLTITWKDPEVAARWANDLVVMTNEYLRSKAIREAEQNIAYLQDQAAKTNVVEVQKAIYSLLEIQIKNAMLARGTNEYALKVIDEAVAPEAPASPNPVIWVLAGLCAGFFASAFFVLVRSSWTEPQ